MSFNITDYKIRLKKPQFNDSVVANLSSSSLLPTYYSSAILSLRMVTDGVDKVWSIDRRSTKILQWDVRTHRLTHIFECDIHNPVGQFVCCTAEDAGMVGAGEKTGESQSGTTETRDNQSRSAEMTGSQNEEKNQSSDNWNKDSLKFSETTLDDVSGDELSKGDMVEGESLADRGITSKSFSPVKTTNPSGMTIANIVSEGRKHFNAVKPRLYTLASLNL